MRRQKVEGASGGFGGDWSDSGTFLRKPASGWLHEDRELMDNSCINYEVEYLGSIEINQSMRTLQFNVRTQVTKEAILRLAEDAGKVYVGKKRKVAKQINKLLGAPDTRQAGSLNLSISVDDLKISNSSGAILMKHSLPSISFASGGDGPTLDFIGYVAKDPVHGRACHVFECRDSSQYVLTTIGQAFELRYKLYLKKPRPNVHPVEVNESWGGDAWGTQRPEPPGGRQPHVVNAEVHRPASISSDTPPPLPPAYNTNIYDDVPQTPPPLPESRPRIPQTPPALPESRPRVYSNLPGFPLADDDISCTPDASTADSAAGIPRLGNPYDTMQLGTSPPMQQQTSANVFSEQGVYSDPGEVSQSGGTYADPNYSDPNYEDSGKLMTIRQIPSSGRDDISDHIDLTPAPPINDYSNLGPNGEILEDAAPKKSAPPKKPPRPPEFMNGDNLYDDAVLPSNHKPVPVAKPRKLTQRSRDLPPKSKVGGAKPQEDIYGNEEVEKVLALRELQRSEDNEYEDAEALDKMVATPPVMSYTPAGTYDNPDEIIGSLVGGVVTENIYDLAEGKEEDELYDDATSNPPVQFQTPLSPKFDDIIYMRQGESSPVSTPSPTPSAAHKPPLMKKPPAPRKPQAFRNMKSMSQALPDPPAPLPRQKYYHGCISRIEAEALLERDGQFLIRESSKRPGQYVLTGMANGQPQHLLLMDKEGKVKSKDHQFDSIPHLVAYFTDKKVPLVIGGSQVFLNESIVNISSY